MKKVIFYCILTACIIALSVCLFSCSGGTITALSAKHEKVSLSLNSSLYIDNYIEYEGKGKLSYAIENTEVLSLSGNKVTAVGIGKGTVIVSAGDLSVRFQVTVIDTLAISITAQDATFEYDGTIKNIDILGSLPQQSVVKYYYNGQEFFGSKEIGEYEVEVEVTFPDKKYANYIKKTAILTITKGVYNMRDISFSSKVFTYDGTEKQVTISGALPEGVSVSYLSNKATNAGVYFAKAVFSYDAANYEPIEEMTAKLTINRRDFVLETSGFDNKTVVYNGKGHKVSLANLPDGLSANYFIVGETEVPMPQEGVINSGTYTIKVYFEIAENSVFSLNYNSVQSRSVTLIVRKASFVSQNLGWKEPMGFVYDGESKTVGTGENFDAGLVGDMPKGVNGEFSEGAAVSYKFAKSDGTIVDAATVNFVNAGSYIILAKFTMPSGYDANYLPLEDMSYNLMIKKAVFDMSLISLPAVDSEGKSYVSPQVFDELQHAFALTADQDFFDKVTVKYFLTRNGGERILINASAVNIYNVGFYKIEAEFELKENKNNYELIASKSITVTINKLIIPLDDVVFADDRNKVYDGQEYYLAVESDTLPSGVSVTYENNNKINAGIYTVIATPKYKEISAENYAFTVGDTVKNTLSAVLKIDKATLKEGDVPEGKYSVVGGEYLHTKTLADYAIVGKEGEEIWWVTPSVVPTVNISSYRVGYNPDKNNYYTYEYLLSLTITKATIDGNTIDFASQFVPYTGVVVKPSFTVVGNGAALKLNYQCETNLIDIGKHDISGITFELLDTVNYQFINSPTITNKYIGIYNSQIFSYSGLQLTKYNGSSANVTVMNGTQSIKSDAFSGNTYIRNITVPYSVTSLGAKAFFGITNLREITLPFVGKTPDSGEKLGAVFGVENSALSAELTKVTITNAGTIYQSAFENAEHIEQIIYGSAVTHIQSYAFYGCSNLKWLSLGSEVQSIGESIFYKCFALQEIVLPFIGANINDIRTISYLVGINSGENLYTNYTCQKIEITSSITALPAKFLANFVSLTTVILPSSITSIGSESFAGISAPIAINDNFTAITFEMFKNYKGSTIVLPSTLQSIGGSAFYGATNLESIVLPLTVTSIGEKAFYNVSATIIFDMDSNISTIGKWAFQSYKGSTVMLPPSLSTLGDYVWEDSTITSIGLSANIINMGVGMFKNCKSLHNAVINTTYLANNMFEGCEALNTITINNVQEIKANALKGCKGLFAITLSENIESIGAGAFSDCLNLVIINIYSDTPPSLGAGAFMTSTAIKIKIKNTASGQMLWAFENAFSGYHNIEVQKLP